MCSSNLTLVCGLAPGIIRVRCCPSRYMVLTRIPRLFSPHLFGTLGRRQLRGLRNIRACSNGSSEPQDLPSHAQVVIIGGGIIGTSVAYHLAEMGVKDVLLLERNRLTSGTTWHAAGLMVTFGSTSETSTEMRMYTRDLYSRLEAETGQSTGFMPVGFIELAADKVYTLRRASRFHTKRANTTATLRQRERAFVAARAHRLEGRNGTAHRFLPVSFIQSEAY